VCLQKKLLENDICNPQNVPSEKYLSQACVHELGLSYAKLDKIPMESQKDDNVVEILCNFIIIDINNISKKLD
jgi:hypothetical protein